MLTWWEVCCIKWALETSPLVDKLWQLHRDPQMVILKEVKYFPTVLLLFPLKERGALAVVPGLPLDSVLDAVVDLQFSNWCWLWLFFICCSLECHGYLFKHVRSSWRTSAGEILPVTDVMSVFSLRCLFSTFVIVYWKLFVAVLSFR